MSMNKSKIGYTNDQYGNEPGKVPVYGWNPGGFGCTGGCKCCWARPLGKRQAHNCEKCANFEVHIHPERLPWPAKKKKPGVVLVNFTCDTWDPARSGMLERDAMLEAAHQAPHHTYVWLTQHPERIKWLTPAPPNWYFGCTIRTQAEADERLPIFLDIPGNLWLSMEPLWGAIAVNDEQAGARLASYGNLKGIIVGHDNRRRAPGTDTLDHIRSVVQQCKAAGVSVYVKQIQHQGRFLRASHPDEFQLYPADLQVRDLPWSMP